MAWIVRNIHLIMFVSGALTLTMVYAAVAPEAALRSTFGESLDGPVADVVVRNWGALIGLMGAMWYSRTWCLLGREFGSGTGHMHNGAHVLDCYPSSVGRARWTSVGSRV
jgi:hypothetical protein